jgi:hypothetical protein
MAQLRDVEPRQAADGVAQVGELLELSQPLHLRGAVQPLPAGRELRLRHLVTALPHAQRGHRHAQHLGHRTAAIARLLQGRIRGGRGVDRDDGRGRGIAHDISLTSS